MKKLILLLTFLLTFMAISCSNDDFRHSKKSDILPVSKEYTIHNLNFKNASFSEIVNSSLFSKVSSKLRLHYSNSIHQNRIDLSNYDFFIDTTDVKIIQKENYISYTFKIIRTENSKESIENLLIENSNGNEKAYIISYTPHQSWTEQYHNGIEVPFYGNVEIEALQKNFENKTNARADCTTFTFIIEIQCSCAGHWPGQSCTCEAEGGTGASSELFSITDCSGGGGGSGTNPGGTIGNPGGGGGSNSPGNGSGGDGSYTTIVGKPEIPTNEEKCQKLKELTQTDSMSINIKPIINQLRAKTGLDKEWSCNFRKQMHYGELRSIPQDGGIQEGSSRTRSKVFTGTTWFGQVHTHPLKTYAIFSWLDLKTLRNLHLDVYQQFKKDVFLMIVCHNGEVYSLKIDNYGVLNTKLNQDLLTAKGSNETEKQENIESNLSKYYQKNKDNLELAFLQKYNSYGISIYKASDNNLTNWEKLELDNSNPNTPTVNQIPCN